LKSLFETIDKLIFDLPKKDKSIGFIVTKVKKGYTLEKLKFFIKSKIQSAKNKLENVP
jgi:plasmid replication initiation protein